ncbi:hypothetical protein ACH61_00042 [Rathayibacter tanaceti]|uniref:Uncharacterized protein n=1 Tax=Rathayibacter tanaceti TaxID=1671680 RepID=A0A168GBE3_9MICO|nr:hypothetical protein ACH61_00042 [Rathayibacter tanaceti]
MLAFIALRLVFVVVHKRTRFPGAGETEQNVVGDLERRPVLVGQDAPRDGWTCSTSTAGRLLRDFDELVRSTLALPLSPVSMGQKREATSYSTSSSPA